MTTPLLSITVPTYRRVDLLERCVTSVIPTDASTRDAVELVISDNSPESTVEDFVERFAPSWPSPLRYHRNAGGTGAVRNFNLCVERAAGLYNLMLHDDDYLLPGAIDEIVRILHAADHARHKVLLFGVRDVTLDEHVIRERRSDRDEFLGPERALRRLLSNSAFVRVPGLIVQSQTYRDVGGFRVSAHTTCDFDMSVRLFSRYGARFLPHVTAAYTVHAGGVTSTVFTPRTIDLNREIFDVAREAGVLDRPAIDGLQRRWFHQFILAGTWRALKDGDRAAARDVFALFDLPQVKAMGISWYWMPVRIAFALLTGAARRPWRAADAAGDVDDGHTGGLPAPDGRHADANRDW